MDSLDGLVCADCTGVLSREGEVASCSVCGRRYPSVGGIPCIFRKEEDVLAAWRERTAEFVAGSRTNVERIADELSRRDLHELTRRRLEAWRDGMAANTDRLLAVLDAAGLAPSDEQQSSAAPGAVAGGAAGKRVGPGQSALVECYDLLHRDWGWGNEPGAENETSLDQLDAVWPFAHTPRKMLVLGAGACRFAYDLHRRFAPERTLALDINPLPMLVARHILRDGSLRLFEFPVNPRTLDAAAVEHELSAPPGAADGFGMVLADGLTPPVQPGTFDTIVTPWFIDQVPRDARQVLAGVHANLPPGGYWINTGPLIYPPDVRLSDRYGMQELLALTEAAGLEVVATQHEEVPYLRSPNSAHSRREWVVTVCARKCATPTPRPETRDGATPAWLLAPHLPVPRFTGLDTLRPRSRALSVVAEMIDGRASIVTITAELIERFGVDPEGALDGTVACVAELFSQSEAADNTGQDPPA